MNNKIISYLIVFLAFITGAAFTFLVIKSDLVSVKNANETTETTSLCTNCAETTTIISNNGLSASVEKIYNTVVMVKNYRNGTANGSGSGVVYKKDDKYGYIITNYHVIDGATEAKIVMANGKTVDGVILGGDEYLDIAVIRINSSDVISVAKIGSSKDLKLGDQVIAMGTPVGENYFNSVTIGHVSGIDRKVTVSVKTTADWVQEVTQIDAAINPGNSGGPLFNVNGEIVGINSMKLVNSSIEGMAFSIKIDDVVNHLEEFENNQKIQRTLLGISYANVTDTYALFRYGVNIPNNITTGVVVISTVEGSGAEKAKLQKGDIITKINDEDVLNKAYLKYILYKYNVGDEIELTYIRDGKEMSTKVTLTENSD